MGAKATNSTATYEEQLSELENRLRGHDSEEAMLADIGLAMRTLLSRSGQGEAHIRQLLERQFEQGNLRQESYELVERLLGKLVAEHEAATPAESPAPGQAGAGREAPYVDTTVLDDPAEPGEPAALEAPRLQVGSVLRDRFLLKACIADGGMGTVYKALDRRMAEIGESNPYVAIKVLNPRLARNSVALRALQQEAAKGRCLSHPNIVRFIDLDREGDEFFIVMEWLEGKSLAKIIDDSKGNKLALPVAMDVIRQVGSALAYAHQRGVVHADIKPGNIVISPDGQARLIDFGVARVRQKENEGKSRFDPDIIRGGSPAYSSMQVLTGEDPVPADDVFSLACLAYRLIAGYRVFGPRNAADAAQEGMEPQQPNELDDRQWAAMKKALSYSRVTRYESAQAFLDAFGADSKVPKKAAPPPAAPRQAPPSRSQPATVRAVREERRLGDDEATVVGIEAPMLAERDSIMYAPDAAARRSPWRLAVVGLIIIASVFVVVETGVIDDLDPALESLSRVVDRVIPRGAAEADGIQVLPGPQESDIAETGAVDAAVTETLVIDAADGTVEKVAGPETEAIPGETAIVDAGADVTVPEGQPAGAAAGVGENVDAADATVPSSPPLPPPEDFSVLSEPDLLLTLADAAGGTPAVGEIVAREGAGDVIVDLVREGDLARQYAVQIVETNTAGRRSGINADRYRFDNDGLVTFEPGQPRVRTTLSLSSNSIREDDRLVTLHIRSTHDQSEEVGLIRLTLEDDDRRAFEAGLAPNTIGFTVDAISVREFDPAVQIEIVRHRPDNSAIEIPFTLTDVSATEGEDYFAPGLPVIYFGPGQRNARILIPLGQDARSEAAESFTVTLDVPDAPQTSNIYQQITVMIRDDDS